jgi:hypothetical protein
MGLNTATYVRIVTFTTHASDSKVTLAWTTGSEVDTAGFHIWRASQANGAYVKVTPTLLPATGISPGGASYTWMDTNVTSGQTWFYKLEDIDTLGVSTFHGPVSTTVGATSSILSFQATPPEVFRGGGSFLSWTVSGNPALFLSGIGPVSGTSLWVSPQSTTSYTLTDGQGAQNLTTVTVKPFQLRDMAGLSKAWGSTKGEAAFDPCFDLNGDGKVNDADVALCLAGR